MKSARRLQLPAALAVAAAIHAGVLIALTRPDEQGYAASFGTGGVTVSLGPAGRAPGGIPSQPVTAEPEVEPPEPLEPVVETSRMAKAETDTVERIQESAVTAAEMSELAPQQVAEAATAQPALAEEPRPEMAETPDATQPVETATAVRPFEEMPAQPVDEVTAQPVEMADLATPDLPPDDPIEQPQRMPEVQTSVPPEPEPPVIEPVVEPAPSRDPQPLEDSVQVTAVEPEPVIERLEAVVEPEPEPVQVARAVPEPPLPPRRPPTPTERPSDTPAPAQPPGQGGVSGTTAEADRGSGEASSGGGAVGASADYSALLLAWLERHKTYPRRAQIQQRQGVVLVRFVIDREGALISSAILESSGHAILDREGLETIQRAAPMPKPPADLAGGRLEWDVPMRFYLQ